MSHRISVVIPTYHEASNLPKLVAALLALPLDLDVLVVDDDSPDGTGRIADKLAAADPGRVDVLHRRGKMGLRSAYLQGFEKVLARGAAAIVQMDGDFSHDPAALTVLAESLKSADVVFGSRYCAGGSVDERWPIWRKALSAFGNLYVRAILGVKVHDRPTVTYFSSKWRIWPTASNSESPSRPSTSQTRHWGTSKMSLGIQLEAAARVWQVWWDYRDVRRGGRAARLSAVLSAR